MMVSIYPRPDPTAEVPHQRKSAADVPVWIGREQSKKAMAMNGRFQHAIAISHGRLREQHDHEVSPSTMLACRPCHQRSPLWSARSLSTSSHFGLLYCSFSRP